MKSLRVGSRPVSGSIVTPSAAVSTRKWRPCAPATTRKSAVPASATAIFVPVSDEPSGSSELSSGDQPASSSHRATVPRRSPAATAGRCSASFAASRRSAAAAFEKNGVGASA